MENKKLPFKTRFWLQCTVCGRSCSVDAKLDKPIPLGEYDYFCRQVGKDSECPVCATKTLLPRIIEDLEGPATELPSGG